MTNAADRPGGAKPVDPVTNALCQALADVDRPVARYLLAVLNDRGVPEAVDLGRRHTMRIGALATLGRTGPDLLLELESALDDYIVAGDFGDIYGRPGLTYEQRQPITVVSLTAQGGVGNHVRTHVNGALTLGLTPSTVLGAMVDIVDLVPPEQVLDSVEIACQVFIERGVTSPA